MAENEYDDSAQDRQRLMAAQSKNTIDQGLHQINTERERAGLSPMSVEEFRAMIRRRLIGK